MDLKGAERAAKLQAAYLEALAAAPVAAEAEKTKEKSLEERFAALEQRAKAFATRQGGPYGRQGEYTSSYIVARTAEGPLPVLSVSVGYGFEVPTPEEEELTPKERQALGYSNDKKTTKLFARWQQTPEGVDVNARANWRFSQAPNPSLEEGAFLPEEQCAAPDQSGWAEVTPDTLTLLEQSFDEFEQAAVAAYEI